MQLARRSQNTLTSWTHFQKEPYQSCSLSEEARTHSLAGHIFRRSLISHAACQKKPEHTHILDTFSEGASSAMQLATRSQNTHFLDTFPGALSAMQLARRSQSTLTPWTHFQNPISHTACQKKPEHTHKLGTFSGALSAMQLARRSQSTLTPWTHFQKEPHQPCSFPEEARPHSLAGHIFRRSLISHAACQKKPEHTHLLNTFSEGVLSAMQLARRSQNTLTSWTHFQKALLDTWPGKFEIHSQPEQKFGTLSRHSPFFKRIKYTYILKSLFCDLLSLDRLILNFYTSWSCYHNILFSEIHILTVFPYKNCLELLISGYNMYYSHTIRK